MNEPIIVDNSQENCDFTKFRQLDIPGVQDIYQLMERAGVEHQASDGDEQIVRFAEPHPWVDGMGLEAAWIINRARERVKKKNKP